MSDTEGRPPRWFLGLVEISGILGGLRTGLRECGADAELHLMRPHAFAYTQDDNAMIPNMAKRAVSWRDRQRSHVPGAIRKAVELLTRSLLFAWAIVHFDVFVFTCGVTFFDGRELPLLRALHKRTVLVFLGSDERPPYLNGVYLTRPGGVSIEEVVLLTHDVHRRVTIADLHADFIVGHPLSAHFHQRTIVALTQMGFPTPHRERPADEGHDAVRIVHAPSHIGAKGSDVIRAAIRVLVDEGLPIDYLEISGATNDEVIEQLGRSDLLIDETWSDSPMSVLTAEAASVGTPSITGGYGWLTLGPDDLEPPVSRVHPNDLVAEIRRLVLDKAERAELGRRAQTYVRRAWSPAAVAHRYLALVAGTLEPGHEFDPADITYVGGAGAPIGLVRTTVVSLVRTRGAAALLLDDKPALREALEALSAHVQPDAAPWIRGGPSPK